MERSSYVLSASPLLLMFRQWRQIPAVIGKTQNPSELCDRWRIPGLIDPALQHISDQPFRLIAG
jgi:hypothetical protein